MAEITHAEKFRAKLFRAVQDAGQEIIDRAPDIVGTGKMLSGMTITINFDPAFQMVTPTITVEKEYLCKCAIDRLWERGENDESAT